MLIKLTNYYSDRSEFVWVNPIHIIRVYNGIASKSDVYLIDGTITKVFETPEEIVELISESSYRLK